MIESNLPILYNLLPAVYRQQDVANGLLLQALFNILQGEIQNIKTQIDLAYSNCFIETCESWVEPYIGDLLGIKGLHNATNLPQQRVRIADTIRFRRRKGQQGVLENVISDVTGWSVHVVPYMQLLGASQHIQHVRSNYSRIMKVRDIYGAATLGSPFEVNAHMVDVHNIPRYPAKFNINNMGLFIWRLSTYPVTGGTPYLIKWQNNIAQFNFNPLGIDIQLFNFSEPPTDFTQSATESQLPVAIRPLALQQDLVNYQGQGDSNYYGPDKSIYITVGATPITPNQVICADLSGWVVPPALQGASPASKVAIDPKLGRFLLASTNPNPTVSVNYYYGFSADLGGGHYDRAASLNTSFTKITVSGGGAALQSAVTQWLNSPQGVSNIVFEIQDDATYSWTSSTVITNPLNAACQLVIQAKNRTRPVIEEVAPLTFKGKSASNNLQVTLNGLLTSGDINLQEYVDLQINHCDMVYLSCTVANSLTKVTINNSMFAGIYLPQDVISLTVSRSIIDAGGQVAVAADMNGYNPGPISSFDQVTILGAVFVEELALLNNSIVTELIATNRTETGVVRFSYLPLDSQTPPRYQCLPDLDFIPLAQQLAPSGEDYTWVKTNNPDWWNNTLQALAPQFTSVRYGDPGYVQLKLNDPNSLLPTSSVTIGADNGAEMGCFNSLNQPQRQVQLQEILQEYSPFGLATGVFYVN